MLQPGITSQPDEIRALPSNAPDRRQVSLRSETPSATGSTFLVEDSCPLSPMHAGMLFHTLLDPRSCQDIVQIVMHLIEDLDIARFRNAWACTSARHAILRTVFRWEGLVEPLPDVRREVPLDFTLADLRGTATVQQEEHLHSFMRQDQNRGFDLRDAPLTRLSAFRLQDARERVVWTFHHIQEATRPHHSVGLVGTR